MVVSRGLRQAYEMQDFAFNASMALKEEMTDALLGKICPPDKDKAAIIAQLGKVWRDAQEQIRIHRGKPLPGSLTHEKVKVPRGRQAALSALSAMPEHAPAEQPSDESASDAT